MDMNKNVEISIEKEVEKKELKNNNANNFNLKKKKKTLSNKEVTYIQFIYGFIIIFVGINFQNLILCV